MTANKIPVGAKSYPVARSLRRFMLSQLLLLAFLPHSPVSATDPEKEARGELEETTSVRKVFDERENLIEAVRPSLVTVRYFLRYDERGKPPIPAGFDCPGCGMKHEFDGERCVDDERPLEIPGYLIAADQAISADVMINPEFIREIRVGNKSGEAPATIANYCVYQPSVILRLAEPLPDSRPLTFASASDEEPGKCFTVSFSLDRGFRQITVRPFKPTTVIELPDIEKKFLAAPPHSVIVDADGNSIGFSTYPGIMNDASWRLSPLSWPNLTTHGMNTLLDGVKSAVSGGIFRVTLLFRSPKLGESRRHAYREQLRVETEFITAGILYKPDKLLVIADLSPRDTARLERIVIHTPKGPIQGAFAGSLRDFGGLVAQLPSAVSPEVFRPLKLSGQSMTGKTWQLLPKANIRIFGEQLDRSIGYTRIEGFEPGQHNRLFPEIVGDNTGVFVFNHKFELLAFPLQRRVRSRTGGKDTPPSHIVSQARYPALALQSLQQHTDPHNVPVKEDEDERLAWLGVEVQPLNSDLAKANHVSHLSDNGKYGVLLTYVYPRSPAAAAGLKPGDILLRLFVDGEPNPRELQSDDYGARAPFPWEHLDRIPESYFDNIPPPWHSVENQFNLTLTNLGFGKKITIQCFIDGKLANRSFVIEKMPEHYEAAPRSTSPELGITVRDLTFEVRRYFQMTTATPGVIISRVVPGGKAAVAGLKPYEIVTRVNGQPVMNVEDFDNLTEGATELRLEVKRMLDNRIVKIQL